MPTLGDLIGNYRLLTQISVTPLNSLYAAEPIFESAYAVLLLVCTGVTVTTPEEQDQLQHTARGANIQHAGSSIAIQDVGTTEQHPYLVTAYSEEALHTLQGYMTDVEQLLQSTYNQYPDDNQAILRDTFLQTLSTPVTNADIPAIATMKPRKKRPSIINKQNVDLWKNRIQGKNPRKRMVTLLTAILVILLVWGGFFVHINVAAANATVTITPVTKGFTQMYNLRVSAEASTDPQTVQGRQITYTSQQKVQTVATTGRGTHPATQAKGRIVFSQLHLNAPNPANNFLTVASLQDANGITITTDAEVDITNQTTVTVDAHASAGSAGNIGAHDIDGAIDLTDPITKANTGTGFVSNPDPFTGGRDAIPFSFVQPSDINNVVNTFVGQLTPDAHAQAQKQIQPNEHMMQDIQCTTNSAPNHQANSEAADVTIKVSVTCSTLVYTDQALRDGATKLYQNAGVTKFGSSYGVVGDMVTSTGAQSGVGSFPVTVNGIWSFQYTPASLQTLRQSIAGKTSEEALKVLHKRPDMRNVTLATSGGIGSAVPTTLSTIQCVVTKVQGLHV